MCFDIDYSKHSWTSCYLQRQCGIDSDEEVGEGEEKTDGITAAAADSKKDSDASSSEEESSEDVRAYG